MGAYERAAGIAKITADVMIDAPPSLMARLQEILNNAKQLIADTFDTTGMITGPTSKRSYQCRRRITKSCADTLIRVFSTTPDPALHSTWRGPKKPTECYAVAGLFAFGHHDLPMQGGELLVLMNDNEDPVCRISMRDAFLRNPEEPLWNLRDRLFIVQEQDRLEVVWRGAYPEAPDDFDFVCGIEALHADTNAQQTSGGIQGVQGVRGASGASGWSGWSSLPTAATITGGPP